MATTTSRTCATFLTSALSPLAAAPSTMTGRSTLGRGSQPHHPHGGSRIHITHETAPLFREAHMGEKSASHVFGVWHTLA
jgi:hypothetical protein